MRSTEMNLYGNKVFGATVSNYGLEHGYLDYRALSEIVGVGESLILELVGIMF